MMMGFIMYKHYADTMALPYILVPHTMLIQWPLRIYWCHTLCWYNGPSVYTGATHYADTMAPPYIVVPHIMLIQWPLRIYWCHTSCWYNGPSVYTGATHYADTMGPPYLLMPHIMLIQWPLRIYWCHTLCWYNGPSVYTGATHHADTMAPPYILVPHTMLIQWPLRIYWCHTSCWYNGPSVSTGATHYADTMASPYILVPQDCIHYAIVSACQRPMGTPSSAKSKKRNTQHAMHGIVNETPYLPWPTSCVTGKFDAALVAGVGASIATILRTWPSANQTFNERKHIDGLSQDCINSSPPEQDGRHSGRRHFQIHFLKWKL